jgi:hypothetical protein
MGCCSETAKDSGVSGRENSFSLASTVASISIYVINNLPTDE